MQEISFLSLIENQTFSREMPLDRPIGFSRTTRLTGLSGPLYHLLSAERFVWDRVCTQCLSYTCSLFYILTAIDFSHHQYIVSQESEHYNDH
jgi:hypothetical protein